MSDLSVLIPARSEEWLARTIEDVLAHSEADTEVIAVLDGAWPDPALKQHERVHVVYVPSAIGQRAATNLAARISEADYIMKLDAHCAVGQGFDRILIETARELGPDVTQIPAQHNLHVFDWVCACGKRDYQGPKHPCGNCGGDMTREMQWKPRKGVLTTSWVFDETIHFQYDGAGKRAQQGDICDVMSSLGACFFMGRERFWDLDGLDEDHGSWGNYGVEVACKSWLSGGRHVVNKRTWFAHFFRTGGINFPYKISGSEQEYARNYSRNLWRGNHWPKQTRPLRWLVDKFWPVPGWTDESRKALPETLGAPAVHTKPSVGLIYYSDNRPPQPLLDVCLEQLQVAAKDLPIVSCTLKPTDLGHNIVLERERGYLTMAIQILTALEAIDTDVVFHAEHDVLYHASHFLLRPKDATTYTYNQHTWKVDYETGRAITYRCNQLSGLLANRTLLLNHFRARVQRIAATGYTNKIGFEPGTHHRAERIDDYGHAVVRSASPNIDLRHKHNLTPTRWSPTLFRQQRFCQGWQESTNVPDWGVTAGRMPEFLASLSPTLQGV